MGNVTKKIVLVIIVVVGILTLLVLAVNSSIWGSLLPNLGLPFGYYGQFNRVMYKLGRIPDVRIVTTYLNEDLSLEDFGILVQTKSGLQLRLQFSEGRENQLFKHADGLLVVDSTWGKGLRYLLGPDGRLEAATGREIRNAVDVLENFDKIAAVIEADRRDGSGESEWKNAPEYCLLIIYPYTIPQTR